MVDKNNILEEKLTPKDRLKIILNPEDFKDYERMVEESEGIISWEKLEEYSEFDENQNLKGIYWKGNLDLSGTSITSLGKLKYVGGNLDLKWTPITDLEYLEKIGGYLDLESTYIKDLGELKEVWGSLNLAGTKIKSLGKLTKVGGFLNLKGSSIINLGDLEKVWGSVNLDGTKIESLFKLKEVGRSLDLSFTSITTLGNLEKVGGSLDLSFTSMISLGNLKEVGDNLGLRGISRKNIKNIIKEIKDKKIHIGGEIIYDGRALDIYKEFSIFFNYLGEFNDDENLDNSKIEKEKQEFIKKYGTSKTKRSYSVKKDLNLIANIFFYFLIDNIIEKGAKTKNQIEELKKSNRDEKSIKEEIISLKLALHNKLDEKFSEIKHYFGEDIKNRLKDEFEKEMADLNIYKKKSKNKLKSKYINIKNIVKKLFKS